MDKIITNNLPNENRITVFLDGHMEKNAGFEKKINSGDGIDQEMTDYIKEHKKDFDTKKNAYVVYSALGAKEAWGANLNGDGFSEKNLIGDGETYGHKTFENGHYFDNHVNKDPKKSKGHIVFSVYNKKMKRVEILVALDRTKAKSDIEKLDAGGHLEVSMGTRVPYDVCSICGCKAKNDQERCEHLAPDDDGKPNKMIRSILKDGRMVYMDNERPKFFDISKVLVAADQTSKDLLKVASFKEADIKKEVPSNIKSTTVLKAKDFQEIIDKASKGEDKDNPIVKLTKEGQYQKAFEMFKESV